MVKKKSWRNLIKNSGKIWKFALKLNNNREGPGLEIELKRVDGRMDGWMGEGESRFKDCLHQSKII